jgi:hypothetical protein
MDSLAIKNKNNKSRDSLEAIEGKRKRGRPPVMSPELVEGFEKLWGDRVTTRRGLLNKHYEVRAYGVIQGMMDEGVTGLEFLLDHVKQKIRSGILRELGRLDEDSIRVYAPAVCEAQKNPETRRTVREWERFLRLLRLHPEIVDVLISETVSENGSDNGVKGNDI